MIWSHGSLFVFLVSFWLFFASRWVTLTIHNVLWNVLKLKLKVNAMKRKCINFTQQSRLWRQLCTFHSIMHSKWNEKNSSIYISDWKQWFNLFYLFWQYQIIIMLKWIVYKILYLILLTVGCVYFGGFKLTIKKNWLKLIHGGTAAVVSSQFHNVPLMIYWYFGLALVARYCKARATEKMNKIMSKFCIFLK